MAVFQYTYIDPRGKRRQGSAEAASMSLLEANLESQGLALLDVRAAGRFASKDDTSKALKSAIPSRQKVKRRELIEFCIYLGTLTEAGVSMTTALRDYLPEIKNEYFQYAMESLLRGIEAGQTLSQGMAQFPDVFTKEFVQMIKAGEQTGTLSNSLTELRSYLEWLERLQGDVKQATTYPLVVSVTLGAFVLYLFSFVIPRIAKILIDMKLELPTITRITLALSDFAVATWWIWIILIIVVPIVLKFARQRNDVVADWIDQVKIDLPFFGGLIRLIIQARFTQNFAVMHRAGISILENLDLCRGFVGNRLYAQAIGQTYNDVREGKSISVSLRESGLFSGLVLRMFAVGEAVGNLDGALRHAAKYYDEEVPRRVKAAFALLEPAIILTLVAIVGFVALAIFLPILSLSGGLR